MLDLYVRAVVSFSGVEDALIGVTVDMFSSGVTAISTTGARILGTISGARDCSWLISNDEDVIYTKGARIDCINGVACSLDTMQNQSLSLSLSL